MHKDSNVPDMRVAVVQNVFLDYTCMYGLVPPNPPYARHSMSLLSRHAGSRGESVHVSDIPRVQECSVYMSVTSPPQLSQAMP